MISMRVILTAILSHCLPEFQFANGERNGTACTRSEVADTYLSESLSIDPICLFSMVDPMLGPGPNPGGGGRVDWAVWAGVGDGPPKPGGGTLTFEELARDMLPDAGRELEVTEFCLGMDSVTMPDCATGWGLGCAPAADKKGDAEDAPPGAPGGPGALARLTGGLDTWTPPKASMFSLRPLAASAGLGLEPPGAAPDTALPLRAGFALGAS
eukprot:scaffold99910_cov32-Prasinocladus_malaysianus.AAC.1